jgi:hypothetical protein
MTRFATAIAAAALLGAACSSAVRPPLAGLSCRGPVSCGREQLLDADRALQHAVQRQGPAEAFADALLPDARYLAEGQGAVAGAQAVRRRLNATAPFAWTLARGDVSANGTLGYTFGWVSAAEGRGLYAAVWKRHGGEWKLAVFLRKPAKAQGATPPAWFGPFRGEREPPPSPAQSVSNADAAFAALAQVTGSTQQAFTAWAAQDAVQLAGAMVFGRDAIHDLLARAPLLRWAPLAGESAADLGYTVGAWQAASARGSYLTVWRLQSDGSWRFVLDAGVSG